MNRVVARRRIVAAVLGGAGLAPPAQPTGLTATQTAATTVALAWADAATNETGYKVYRSTDNVTYTLIDTIAAGSTSYNATSLTAGTTYYFKVAAYNGAGETLSAAATVICYLIKDLFTDADATAITAHTPNINAPGNAWVNTSGTTTIQANTAKSSGGVASIDSGQAALTITLDAIPASNGTLGIAFRLTDNTHYWLAGVGRDGTGRVKLNLWENDAGFTLRASQVHASVNYLAGTTYALKVVYSGNDIVATMPDLSLSASYTSSFNNTATKIGLRASDQNDAFDNLLVYF